MKKIFLVVVVFLIFIKSGFCASSNELSYTIIRPTNTYFCADGIEYPHYIIYNAGRQLFFLNYSQNYNLDLSTYYQVDIASTPFNEKLYEEVAYSNAYNFPKRINFYNEVVTLKLWSILYPNLDFKICKAVGSSYNSAIYNSKIIFDNVSKGPEEFKQDIYLEEKEERTIAYNYFRYFEVIDNGGLDVSLTDNSITFSGENGEHTLILKRKARKDRVPPIYTDGTNYIIGEGDFPGKLYTLKVKIGYQDFSFTAQDEDNKVLSNTEFALYKDGKFYMNIRTDENGHYQGLLPRGNYYMIASSSTKEHHFVVSDDTTLKVIVPSSENKDDEPNDNEDKTLETPEKVPEIKPEIDTKPSVKPSEEKKDEVNESLESKEESPTQNAITSIIKDTKEKFNKQMTNGSNMVGYTFPDTLCL